MPVISIYHVHVWAVKVDMNLLENSCSLDLSFAPTVSDLFVTSVISSCMEVYVIMTVAVPGTCILSHWFSDR